MSYTGPDNPVDPRCFEYIFNLGFRTLGSIRKGSMDVLVVNAGYNGIANVDGTEQRVQIGDKFRIQRAVQQQDGFYLEGILNDQEANMFVQYHRLNGFGKNWMTWNKQFDGPDFHTSRALLKKCFSPSGTAPSEAQSAYSLEEASAQVAAEQLTFPDGLEYIIQEPLRQHNIPDTNINYAPVVFLGALLLMAGVAALGSVFQD